MSHLAFQLRLGIVRPRLHLNITGKLGCVAFGGWNFPRKDYWAQGDLTLVLYIGETTPNLLIPNWSDRHFRLA
jgi:hypothetical protein